MTDSFGEDLAFFFREKPEAQALYKVFAQKVFDQVDSVDVKVQKTQIAFRNKHYFAFVSLLPVRKKAQRPDTYITVSFGLRRRLDSPRIDAAAEPYPERWTHHMLLSDPAQIDGELLGWIEQAAVFAARK